MICVFVDVDFSGFDKKKLFKLSFFVMMIEYVVDIKVLIVFVLEFLINVLGEWLEK